MRAATEALNIPSTNPLLLHTYSIVAQIHLIAQHNGINGSMTENHLTMAKQHGGIS